MVLLEGQENAGPVTVPVPEPPFCTVSAWVVGAEGGIGCAATPNVAVQVRLLVIVTSPEDEQSPPQPMKVEPNDGIAERVRLVPAG